MTYQPFLPEAAAGSVEPRHVVVPLRRVLRKCQVLTGAGHAIDHAAREVTVAAGRRRTSTTLAYDVLVVAPGSVARTLPIPGLAEHGIGVQDRSTRPSPCATTCSTRLDAADDHDDPAAAAAAAHLRRSSAAATPASRRWPSSRTWPATRPRYYPDCRPARHALGARRGDRPDPARGRRGHGPLHGRASCWTRSIDVRPRHPAGVVRRRARRALRRRGVRRRHASSGRPA